jgi:hypothetical protein
MRLSHSTPVARRLQFNLDDLHAVECKNNRDIILLAFPCFQITFSYLEIVFQTICLKECSGKQVHYFIKWS